MILLILLVKKTKNKKWRMILLLFLKVYLRNRKVCVKRSVVKEKNVVKQKKVVKKAVGKGKDVVKKTVSKDKNKYEDYTVISDGDFDDDDDDFVCKADVQGRGRYHKKNKTVVDSSSDVDVKDV
ncbi:hypothetical protein M5689_018883 [Euphorbia peplus]|nr:hypothetical protein M5689_018883 [Euphorbia peplus]